MPGETTIESTGSAAGKPGAEAIAPRGPYHPALTASTSGLLLWFAFPPAERGYLAWFALVPLLLLVRREESARRVYLGAWAGGLTFWVLAVEWVRRADPSAWLAWIALATALSLWWPAFLYLARLAVRRLRLPLMVAAPIVWVALEYARAHLLTGFPWYDLAHSQYRFLPIIQVSDVSGAYGVSFLIMLVNAWLADVLMLPLRRPTASGSRFDRAQVVRTAVVVAAIGTALAYGGYRLASARFRPGPRVALIQSDVPQEYKMGRDVDGLIRDSENLLARAVRKSPRPDLIVWPETSIPDGFTRILPGLSEAEFADQARRFFEAKPADVRRFRDRSDRYLHGLVDSSGIPMLFGSAEHVFGPGGLLRYNASILMKPGEPGIQEYRKRHLVPFGEYLPFRKTFPFLVALTPYEADRVPSLDAGTSTAPLSLNRETDLAAAICFEDTIPHVVRAGFDRPRSPDILVNQSNDGWFQGSSEHDMHLAIGVFRAVENRVPLVRSANRGISAVVDGNGSILETIPKLKADVLCRAVPLDGRVSAYSRWGDWLPLGCLAVTIGLVPQAYLRHRSRRELPRPK